MKRLFNSSFTVARMSRDSTQTWVLWDLKNVTLVPQTSKMSNNDPIQKKYFADHRKFPDYSSTLDHSCRERKRNGYLLPKIITFMYKRKRKNMHLRKNYRRTLFDVWGCTKSRISLGSLAAVSCTRTCAGLKVSASPVFTWKLDWGRDTVIPCVDLRLVRKDLRSIRDLRSSTCLL